MAEQTEEVKVDKLARGIKEKKASGPLLGLLHTGTISGSQELANGASVTFTATLSNPFGLRIFGVPNYTLFEGSVADANVIPEGSSVTYTDWTTHGRSDHHASDTYNSKFKVFVVNNSGGTLTVILNLSYKYMVEDSS